MKLSMQNASDIITAYIVEKLMPQSSIPGKVKLGFILPAIPSYLVSQVPTGTTLGLIDTESNIDMSMFEQCAKSAIKYADKVSVAGFTFGKDDVDQFFQFVAQNTAPQQQVAAQPAG